LILTPQNKANLEKSHGKKKRKEEPLDAGAMPHVRKKKLAKNHGAVGVPKKKGGKSDGGVRPKRMYHDLSHVQTNLSYSVLKRGEPKAHKS